MSLLRHILVGAVLVILGAEPALAQSVTLDLGSGGSTTTRIIQVILMVTAITLAPSLVLMVTCFTRLLIVFGIVRQAIGTGSTPPNTVILGLTLFLTGFIMAPTFEAAWNNGVQPMLNEQMDETEAIVAAIEPFRAFMLDHVRGKDLTLFLEMAERDPLTPEAEVPLQSLIPAFIISELRRAFEIGFMIYLPFIVIDMVVASVLMSMGMMMLPPIMLSMPFKLIFFVLVDGWYLLVGSLVSSYGVMAVGG